MSDEMYWLIGGMLLLLSVIYVCMDTRIDKLEQRIKQLEGADK